MWVKSKIRIKKLNHEGSAEALKRQFNWRKRVGIEPTHHRITAAHTGFEVQAAHQDRSASVQRRSMIILSKSSFVKCVRSYKLVSGDTITDSTSKPLSLSLATTSLLSISSIRIIILYLFFCLSK